MKKILSILLILATPIYAADTTSDVAAFLQSAYPLGGHSVSEGIAAFHPDFYEHGYTQPTQAEIDALVANYTSLDSVKARKFTEIKFKAQVLYNSVSLLWGTPAGEEYKTALLAVPITAQTDLAALPDVESVKNYQPVWPAKPGL